MPLLITSKKSSDGHDPPELFFYTPNPDGGSYGASNI